MAQSAPSSEWGRGRTATPKPGGDVQFAQFALRGPLPAACPETMRCYFMRDGRIQNVELLRDGADEDPIEQVKRLFQEHNTTQQYDGFEVWSRKRFVYREAK